MKKRIFDLSVSLLVILTLWINIIVIGFSGIQVEGVGLVALTLILFITIYKYYISSNPKPLFYWCCFTMGALIVSFFFEDVIWYASIVVMLPIGYMIYYLYSA